MANDFTKRQIEQFAKLSVLCGCGKNHTVATAKIEVTESTDKTLPTVVEKLLPAGNILLVTDESLYSRYVRSAEKALQVNYLVTVHLFPEGFQPDIKDAGRLLNYGDEIRLVVAYGGGSVADVAKYYAALAGLPLVVVGVSPAADNYLSPYAVLRAGAVWKRMLAKEPEAFLLDANAIANAPQELTARGFGGAASRFVTLFDISYHLALRGGYYCQSVVRLLQHALGLAIAESEGLIAGERGSKIALARALALIGIAEQMTAPHAFYGAEMGVGEVLDRLTEGKLGYGACRMIAASKLILLYRHYFAQEVRSLAPPPDYALRADGWERVFERSQKEYLLEVAARPTRDEVADRHIENEYRADFFAYLTSVESKLSAAYVTCKRIYPDRGSFLEGGFTSAQLKESLFLGTETGGDRYTLLCGLRDNGLLEKLTEGA